MPIGATILLCAASAYGGDDGRWYTLAFNDEQAGYQHVARSQADELITTASTEAMTLSRAGAVTTVESSVTWVETAAGEPRSMTWVQTMGGPAVTTTWTFNGDVIDVMVEQGGRIQHDQVAAPTTPWLPPGASHRLIVEQAGAGVETIVFSTMMPDFGTTPVQKHMTRLGAETVEGPDGAIATTRWSDQTQGLPLEVEVWLDAEYLPVRTDMSAPFGRIASQLSTRQVALGTTPHDAPELFVRMFVEPDGTLGRQLDVRRAFLRLRRKDGKTLDLPASGAQTLAGQSSDGVLLLVEHHGALPPLPGERGDTSFLEPSAMIDASDEAVIRRRDAAVGDLDAGDQAARAEAMRRDVHGWIRDKDLSTAFASASETARSRTGDCSEHGVLLAAMLRADGIPSRVASGLVWMDHAEAFGWHMWTQALIDGQWVDLDATLPVPFTPGHVLVSTSAMATEDGMAQMMDMIDLLGNLDIDVVRVDR